jgi:RNA polymerase sigma factor (sigma-70 family)
MRSSTISCKAERLTDNDDHLLTAQAQQGDAEAFGLVATRHRSSALRVAAVVLGSASGADDVVQDASVLAWRALHTFDPQRSFRAWYLRIVANTAHNHRRGRGRRAALSLRSYSPDRPVDPADAAVTDAERRAVLTAMNRLPVADRLIIALRHFEQLSEAEIAMTLDCPNGTVKSRLSRAMTRLRSELIRDRS